jgi:hypothetical protein
LLKVLKILTTEETTQVLEVVTILGNGFLFGAFNFNELVKNHVNHQVIVL